MRIASIVGTRPQFVKLAPLDKRLRGRHEHIIINTGQHYDHALSGGFFEELGIAPADFDLEVGSGSHAKQTALMLVALEEILGQIKPDLTLVYGDTNSTLGGALTAVKIGLPVAHIEAGYRSADMSMPEEVNRVVTDRIAHLHFAPTKEASNKLEQEGADSRRVFLVGNIMAETLLANRDRLADRDVIGRLGLKPKEFILLTVHRPENTNDSRRLASILAGVADSPLPVVFPVHPRTRAVMPGVNSPFELTAPLSYLDCLALQQDARLVLTDSGGIQEEAFILGTPCLTLRYNTERRETLSKGANMLVGAELELIRDNLLKIIAEPPAGWDPLPLWDGEVSTRIVAGIEKTVPELALGPQVLDLVSGQAA